MVKEEINTLNGDKIHRVRRSMELQPEVIKLENKRSSKRGFNSPAEKLVNTVLICLAIQSKATCTG